MNLSQFFISRPVFAGVLSALILIAGLISIPNLPISEYPQVVPPTVVVRTTYPGANPKVIADTVAGPLEQSITGIEDMLYQFSQATADGVMTLTITFKLGTDVDKAQQLVQNRVAQATPKLPQDVQRIGVTVNKSTPDITMGVFLTSPDGRYDLNYLSNYMILHVKDELAKIDGVGDVQQFGGGNYSMRVWLDPDKVAARGLTATDIANAIREQNVQVAAGQLGSSSQPNVSDGSTKPNFQIAVNTKGRLIDEDDFANIIIRTGNEGQITRLRDVARVELGSDNYALRAMLNNKTAVGVGIFQRPGSNAIAISDAVRAKMAELKKSFPDGIDYDPAYDPTVFVRGSISAVLHTLLEAILLVVIVVIVFLQTWRASIIPLLAVPVSLIGTLGVMHLFGFGLNTLSLFGLVLAIGIVVDDAIVVVENVERNISEGLSPIEATKQAMREVTGPIIATALVLCAVFLPTAFISGLSGEFYKQFALTIAISTVISAFNSLTLSPALSALLLKSHDAKPDRLTRILNGALGWFFRPFNRFFAWASNGYVGTVSRVLGRSSIAVFIYAGLIALTAYGFARTPSGFVPPQDKQYLVGFAQLPDAATLDRTTDVIRRMTDIALKTPGVESVPAFPGLSINGFTNAPNMGIAFTPLKPFEERRDPSMSAGAIAMAMNMQFSQIQDAFIAIFPPPPVQGLGTIGGFKLQIEDRANLGADELYKQLQNVIAKASKRPELAGVFSGFQVNVPQIDLEVDREKAKTAGVPLQNIYDTMQMYLGSLYVNDFNRFGRTYQVNAQAEPGFRLNGADIGRLKTRNERGDMIPLASFVTARETSGPGSRAALQRLSRRGIERRRRAGLQLRSGAGGDRRSARAGIAERHDLRVDRSHVPANPRRQHDGLHLPAGRAARVPRARRAVRKRDAAAGRDPDRADVSALRDPRRDDHVRRQQHLHADRTDRAHRTRLQERDPDRRIRERPRSAGRIGMASRARRVPPAPASDPDDLARVRDGRDPARHLARRRRGDAPRDGRGGVLRHARRDVLRPDADAGVLSHRAAPPRETICK